jgi:hypothetical protein
MWSMLDVQWEPIRLWNRIGECTNLVTANQ